VEDHRCCQGIWEVKREAETTFIQPQEEIKGNLIVVYLKGMEGVIEKMEPNFSQTCIQWKNEMQ